MEYNVDLLDGLDIYQENSLTIILKQIEPRSNVLEFGPAYGRMTRFLNENLGCRVSCVEINPNAKEELEKYAEKVYIGNIESYDWIREFEQGEFDYIIFADVLEHLINPDKVLKQAIFFLKAKGKIFISVPNIAHNAIIRSLYSNKFQYQECGILDKTHVRFFAMDTLEKMVKECGLNICARFATYYNDEMTGILEETNETNDELLISLSQRPFANVYQFVYTLCKEPFENVECLNRIEKWIKRDTIKIYLDKGLGFSEEESFEKVINEDCNGTVEIFFDEVDCIKNLRIDPLDASCICCLNEISFKDIDGNECKIERDGITTNALLSFEHTYVFDNDDPQFIICNINKVIKSIKISIEILCRDMVNTQLFNVLGNKLKNVLKEYEESKNETESVKRESEERAIKVAELNCQVNYMQTELTEVKKELDKRTVKMTELTHQIDCMQTELIKKEEKIFTKNLELLNFHDLNL